MRPFQRGLSSVRRLALRHAGSKNVLSSIPYIVFGDCINFLAVTRKEIDGIVRTLLADIKRRFY